MSAARKISVCCALSLALALASQPATAAPRTPAGLSVTNLWDALQSAWDHLWSPAQEAQPQSPAEKVGPQIDDAGASAGTPPAGCIEDACANIGPVISDEG